MIDHFIKRDTERQRTSKTLYGLCKTSFKLKTNP